MERKSASPAKSFKPALSSTATVSTMTLNDNATARLSIAILGTCDTKLQELLYLRSQILSHAEDASVTLIDVGRSPISDPAITIPQDELLQKYGSFTPAPLSTVPRSQVTQTMTECATACLEDLHSKGSIHGVISAGGSSGTSLTSAAMRRALPFLFPKLIVSTMASGDTAPFVGESDITLMYSIVDIAGSNSILNGVLDNAAGAIVGMARAYQKRQIPSQQSEDSTVPQKPKTKIGITMFGVTTPAVDRIREHLTTHHPSTEIYIFHATGHGGRAMERLIATHHLTAIIDLTTSEITDHIVGGVLSAGPHRLEAGLAAGIPYILSVGACDMANFGPRHTVPERFLTTNTNNNTARKIHAHNEAVTLVRANAEESRRIGEFIAGKVREYCRRQEMVEIVLPVAGISPLSVQGGPFEDREADEGLFAGIERGVEGMVGVRVVREERDVNDGGFAVGLAERVMRLVAVWEG
ncbi:MAG: hypothetical protein LQ339_005707 [Xanthoria mediterranea]|nr:MAG: hypothetical protein LQ339_005707 [Xanthoria mediterranea]